MKSLLPLLVLMSVMSSGCVLRGDGRKIAYGIDGVAVVAGATMMVSGKAEVDRCDERDRNTDTHGGFGVDLCGLGGAMAYEGGKLLLAGGLLAMLINYAINRPDPEPVDEQRAPPTVVAVVTEPRPVHRSSACAAQIAAWRREKTSERKANRYDAMTAECQAVMWLDARTQPMAESPAMTE